jgi:ribonuclease J
MDRFRSFYTVAKDNDRKIVISPKNAYLLRKILSDERLSLPDPLKDENILVYYKQKRSGSFEDKDYYIWERDFMDKMATHEYVHKNQDKLVMDLGLYQFAELIDIRPRSSSHFIHSTSEPFSEEDIEDKVMHNWLKHFNMHFHQLHASGHMNRLQISELINNIKPNICFPIHTQNPQLFTKHYEKVQVIEKQKEYEL